ncbi:MAG: hypothetical protein J1F41_08760 [Lachnospiraceae bacterium]|nr:hypothetical protein [Lachnospiraceae bacterium]
MYTEMYITDDEKEKKKKHWRTAGIILWIVMIGLSLFFTFQSLMIS